MNRYWLLGSLLSLSLYAADSAEDTPSEVVETPVEDATPIEEDKIDETPPPPEVVEAQLRDAEAEFNEAKEMFNPWYAGPLLTPGAHILPPGNINVQPYLFYISNYGRFDSHGHSHKISRLTTINPTASALVWNLAVDASFFQSSRGLE